MPNIPKKVTDRFSKQLSLFQKILREAKDRDLNESNTVTIVTDMLADVFGYDKYIDVTSEQAIRGTFCDVAIKIGGSIKFLIEVKAIGLSLKENHLQQAVNYGANLGIPWIILTNGIHWEIYRLKFEKPVDKEKTCSIDILQLNARKSEDVERLFLICKEGLAKDAIGEFHQHAQNVNRFIVAALIQADSVLEVLRREIRRLAPDTRVSVEEISAILPDVLKRDVVEGESARMAQRRVNKVARKVQKTIQAKSTDENQDPDPAK